MSIELGANQGDVDSNRHSLAQVCFGLVVFMSVLYNVGGGGRSSVEGG